MTGNLKLFELKKLEDTRMKIVIINGSARKGNTLTAINAFIKGASEKKSLNPTNSTLHHAGDVVSVNALRDASIRMIQILQLIKLLPQI